MSGFQLAISLETTLTTAKLTDNQESKISSKTK